jgi:hypothetical protein
MSDGLVKILEIAHLCEGRCAERETAQETASSFVTVPSEWVHGLWGACSCPRSGSTTMDFAEWSGTGLLGIIYWDIGMRASGALSPRPTIIKNRADAADRVNSPPSEGECFGSGLLAHDIGEEGRGGGSGGNGGHFWGICGERGVDGVRRGAIGTIGGDRSRTVPVVVTACSVDWHGLGMGDFVGSVVGHCERDGESERKKATACPQMINSRGFLDSNSAWRPEIAIGIEDLPHTHRVRLNWKRTLS